jgi:mannose PTS system EIIA component
MVGLLLITHAPVGAALLQAAVHVYGKELQQCRSLDVRPDEPMSGVQQQACAIIDELDSGQGVLVFSDLYGATPCNCATALSAPGRVEVISGVSLPLIVRALNYRNLPLSELSERLISGASQSVVRIVGRAPQNQSFRTVDGAQSRAAQQQQQ